MVIRTVKILFTVFAWMILSVSAANAETLTDVQNLIEIRQEQIEEIEKQISEYWEVVEEKKQKGGSVEKEVNILKDKIKQSELQVRSLQLAVEEAGYKLQQTEAKLGDTSSQLEKVRGRLAVALRLLQQREEIPLMLRFAETDKLSDMFVVLGEIDKFHRSLNKVLTSLRDKKIELEETRDSIAEEKASREKLKKIEEAQKEIIASRKNRQQQLLTSIEKEKDQIIGKIVGKKQDLAKVQEQITYLNKVGVSVEEAVRFGELAAIRAGIRTAFLIAVLEVESRLGLNVGSGTYKVDMHTRDRNAFLSITEKLGLDPDTTSVSRKPNYGWGGAMGPAQFLPNTWLVYEDDVAKLTGHNPPSPWSIEDAFTAAALKLSRQGASSKTRAGESKATRAYIGGSTTCSKSICNYYSNLVADKADEIEAELGK